jgi:hypothetical protein
VAAIGALSAAVLISGVAGARAFPSPGTPQQVAALVASSHAIERLPSSLVPPLADLGADNAAAWGYWKVAHGCTTVTECAYGDKGASASVVLLGDSHAAMWLPALDWVGHHLGFRVVLLWEPGCPAADVTVLSDRTHRVDAACNAFRKAALSAITTLAPELVLTANRTTNVEGPGGRFVTSRAWQAGLTATISTLLAAKLRVAVIGDVTALTSRIPQCLAAYPSTVQRCSSPNPNPAEHTERKAELAAAKATGVPYLDPEPWLCTKVCSPVVGTYATYYDWQHVSATYAAFLSLEWEGALKPLLVGGAAQRRTGASARPSTVVR